MGDAVKRRCDDCGKPLSFLKGGVFSWENGHCRACLGEDREKCRSERDDHQEKARPVAEMAVDDAPVDEPVVDPLLVLGVERRPTDDELRTLGGLFLLLRTQLREIHDSPGDVRQALLETLRDWSIVPATKTPPGERTALDWAAGIADVGLEPVKAIHTVARFRKQKPEADDEEERRAALRVEADLRRYYPAVRESLVAADPARYKALPTEIPGSSILSNDATGQRRIRRE